MSIVKIFLSIPAIPNSLTSAEALTTKLSQLSLTIPISKPYKTTPIRMGGLPRPRPGGEAQGMSGGPRPYPGGEALLEWKTMQGKKSKEALKARLDRERLIYKKRKRAEIKAAVSELERPWETPPKRKTDELTAPSENFESSGLEEDSNPSQISGKMGLLGNQYGRNSRSNHSGLNNGRIVNNLEPRSLNGVEKQGENRNLKGKLRKKRKRLGNARFHNRFDARSRRPGDSSTEFRRSNSFKKEVLDMSMHNDGSYGFELG